MYAIKGMSVTDLIGCVARKTGLFGMYQKGLGHLQYHEYEQAYQTWLKLAEGGHAQSQFDLGVMFHNGMGLDIDTNKSLRWFEKAASQDQAMRNYGRMNYQTNLDKHEYAL